MFRARMPLSEVKEFSTLIRIMVGYSPHLGLPLPMGSVRQLRLYHMLISYNLFDLFFIFPTKVSC